jgi:hypothetical protein
MNESVSHDFLVTSRTLLRGVLYALRLTAFAVLSSLEPFVVVVLSLLAFAGFATCFLYRVVAHAPHFPLALMLSLSTGVSALLVLYRLVMRALTP